jgi:predicted nucleic acid-binding protein
MALNVVSNASPLMVFSKLNVLHLLKELYGRVEFPLSVYRETVSAGIRRGFADAQILDSFFLQNNWKREHYQFVKAENNPPLRNLMRVTRRGGFIPPDK